MNGGYTQYQQTEILGLGILPINWRVKRVKHLFSIGRGRVISQEELENNGRYPVYSSQTNNNGCLGYIDTYDFDCEQLTWTTDGANAGTIFFRKGKHNCTNVCGTLKLNNKLTILNFSAYSLGYCSQFHKRPDTNGAKIMNNEMAEICLPLPSKTEQEKIAAFLDHETAKIDTLIDKQQQLIELLKEKRQAVISHAVTKGLDPDVPMKDSGVEWLGEVPDHWVISQIKYLSSFVGTGGTPKNPESFTDLDGIDWFSPGDFNSSLILQDANKKISKLSIRNGDAKIYPKNSIVVIGIGATLGKVALTENFFSCNQQINIIVPNEKINFKYLAYSLSNQVEQMQQASNASTIGIMNQEKTKKIWIVFPKKHEQFEIVKFISKKTTEFDLLLNWSEKQIQFLKERRTALISAAVTGKIDVRDWQIPVTQTESDEVMA